MQFVPADNYLPEMGRKRNVTVVNAFPPTISPSELTTSKTVDRAEDSKVQYYKPVFAKLPTFTFILCAFDSLGQTGPGAKSVLKDIFSILHATTPSRFLSSSVKTTASSYDSKTANYDSKRIRSSPEAIGEPQR